MCDGAKDKKCARVMEECVRACVSELKREKKKVEIFLLQNKREIKNDRLMVAFRFFA